MVLVLFLYQVEHILQDLDGLLTFSYQLIYHLDLLLQPITLQLLSYRLNSRFLLKKYVVAFLQFIHQLLCHLVRLWITWQVPNLFGNLLYFNVLSLTDLFPDIHFLRCYLELIEWPFYLLYVLNDTLTSKLNHFSPIYTIFVTRRSFFAWLWWLTWGWRLFNLLFLNLNV